MRLAVRCQVGETRVGRVSLHRRCEYNRACIRRCHAGISIADVHSRKSARNRCDSERRTISVLASAFSAFFICVQLAPLSVERQTPPFVLSGIALFCGNGAA